MINQLGIKIAVIGALISPAIVFNNHVLDKPSSIKTAQAPRQIPVHHKQINGVNSVIFKQCVLLTEYVECK
jgi:hypothetical protein